jgi:hypothetical protein
VLNDSCSRRSSRNEIAFFTTSEDRAIVRIKSERPAKEANDKERRIQRALLARSEREQMPTFRDLALKFGIPHSVLCDRTSGNTRNQQIVHENQQKLPPTTENTLR